MLTVSSHSMKMWNALYILIYQLNNQCNTASWVHLISFKHIYNRFYSSSSSMYYERKLKNWNGKGLKMRFTTFTAIKIDTYHSCNHHTISSAETHCSYYTFNQHAHKCHTYNHPSCSDIVVSWLLHISKDECIIIQVIDSSGSTHKCRKAHYLLLSKRTKANKQPIYRWCV